MVRTKQAARRYPPGNSIRQPRPPVPPPPPRRQHRKRRWKPGTVALREIRHYQKTTHLLIPKAPFQKLVREIMEGILIRNNRTQFPDTSRAKQPDRWTAQALLALQEAAEAYLIDLFGDSVYAAVHARRVTVTDRDLRIVRFFRRWKDSPRGGQQG